MRLAPNHPFPPYSYVPGKFPHPVSDPKGHAYGTQEIPAASITPTDWTASDPYLFGIDLFNHGYYWESHESWEAVWHAVGRAGRQADFLKALIKLAAALVKAREGKRDGVIRHGQRATELLQSVLRRGDSNEMMGLLLSDLIELAKSVAESPDRLLATAAESISASLLEVELIPNRDNATPPIQRKRP